MIGAIRAAKPDCAMHRAYGLTQDARLDFHGMDL